mgnify:CR=1 FL=1
MSGKKIKILRQWVQVIFFLLFLGFFITATNHTIPNDWSNLFFRFDPLVAITAMIAGRALIVGMLFSVVIILLTILFGRVWCGWICPLGSILDWITPNKRKPAGNEPPDQWRVVKYFLLFMIVCAAIFGNQTLLFLDPITILSRTFTSAIWPALYYAVNSTEKVLFQIEPLAPAIDVFHTYFVFPLFRDISAYFINAFPIMFFFIGIVGLNWIAERFWCRYICPLGGLLGFFSRFSLVRREVGEGCSGCGLCSKRCPTGTIDPKKNFISDPAECTVCYDCVASCSKGDTSFRLQFPGYKPGSHQKYDLTRRKTIMALGAAAALTATSGIESIRKTIPAHMIRPPGARLVDFESLCIRCGACVRICPTQGLQPTLFESGLQNFLTPALVPRLGYCNYNCNACGQVCPTGAIPLMSMQEKQKTSIGLARVDRTRCLPWAYNIPCIVCEEMCPLPDKAIRLEETVVENASGESIQVQRPYVVKELCIGCGICEYKCPMGGDSAIRVFAYTEAGGSFYQ